MCVANSGTLRGLGILESLCDEKIIREREIGLRTYNKAQGKGKVYAWSKMWLWKGVL